MTALRVIFNAVYEFDPPARGLSLALRLRPLPRPGQFASGIRVAALPDLDDRHAGTDAYGVVTETGAISQPVRRLQVNSDLTVVLSAAGSLPEIAADAEDLAAEDMSAAPKREIAFAAGLDLVRAATAGWVYDIRLPATSRPLAELAIERRGGCEDAARLCAAVLRDHGTPVRFMVGYLGALANPAQRQRRRHAWLAFWTHDRGWSEVDPLNPAAGIPLIATAWGPRLAALQPISGTFAAGLVKRSSVEIQIVQALDRIVG